MKVTIADIEKMQPGTIFTLCEINVQFIVIYVGGDFGCNMLARLSGIDRGIARHPANYFTPKETEIKL